MAGISSIRAALAVAAAVALVLCLPGVGAAGLSTDYQGRVQGDPFSRIGLDIAKRGGKRVIGNLRYEMETACRTLRGAPQARGEMKGFIQIRKGRFEAERAGRNFDDPAGDDDVSVSLKGRVVSKRVLRGQIRVRELQRDGMSSSRCDTGKARFRVRKTAG